MPVFRPSWIPTSLHLAGITDAMSFIRSLRPGDGPTLPVDGGPISPVILHAADSTVNLPFTHNEP